MFQLTEVQEILRERERYEDGKNVFIAKVATAFFEQHIPREQLVQWCELCVKDPRLIAELLEHVDDWNEGMQKSL